VKKRDGLVFSPSDLVVFLESPFASWMDRFHLENPGELTPDPPAADVALAAQMGLAHEARELARIRGAGLDVWEPPHRDRAVETTREAIREGRAVVYQAALAKESFEGFADFLIRVDRPSALGDFSYEVSDTKLARHPRPYFLVQLLAYATMLEELQGRLPEHVHVVTGDGAKHSFRTEDHLHYFRALERAFLAAQASFDPARRPIPEARAEHRRWASHAERILEELDHPSRVAGINVAQIKNLAAAGMHTMTELAASTAVHVPRIDDAALARLRRQAQLQIGSVGRERPLHDLLLPSPSEPRRGLALLPPASAGDVYFDMEGYPYFGSVSAGDPGGLEYLFGAVHLADSGAPGERRYFETWAHDRASEKLAFEGMVDWLTARRAADPSMHVYHYAPYEVTALRRLATAHASREEEVDALLRAEVFVDLFRIVRQSLLLGEPRYSLKNVEHLYRGKRAGDVATAAQSVTEYARWMAAPDGATWQTSKVLAGIRDYNIEDCVSTLELCAWLRERQREAGVAFVPTPGAAPKSPAEEAPSPSPSAPAAPAATPRELRDALARRIRDAIPEDTSGDPERWRVQRLLADLVHFHWRERKPVYWARFHRRDATHAELTDDLECLGHLERTASPPVYTPAHGRAPETALLEYRFDPDQETKLEPGRCLLSGDLRRVDLATIDREHGLATLRVPRESAPLPDVISLLPDDVVAARPIDEAVAAIVEERLRALESGSPRPSALDTLIHRRPPRIAGHPAGSPLVPGGTAPAEITAHVVRLVTNLDATTLAIQGPPGSGKTTTAAHAIVELLRRGRRVGVTSNGHRAIEKLMQEVAALAARDPSVPLRALKIHRDASEAIVASGMAEHATSMREVDHATSTRPNLVGGTAWAFCHESAIGGFDDLFVDEASQVPLANVVGMSRATRNLVLLGDPMQLGQPQKGYHPGESGRSALGYLLGSSRTIAPELGVFLGTSWRMHPALCRVVSNAVYEGRLGADPANETRIVRLPEDGGELVRAEAGVLFVPVVHEGNAQSSEEEVAAVQAIVRELLGRELVEKRGRGSPSGGGADAPPIGRPITHRDILVVAPYNMQVRALRAALPAEVRVGTVDKFQGQEAPIAIVSMCASSADRVPRGLGFLFSESRANVALSRAQALAIVVASPALALARVDTAAQMRRVSFFCRIREQIVPPGARIA